MAAKKAADAAARTIETQAEFVSAINQTVDTMEHFETEADMHLSQFPRVERQYRDLTARVAEDVNHERNLSSPPAGVIRSRFAGDAYRASAATDELHSEGEILQSTFRQHIDPLADKELEYERGCHVDPRPGWASVESQRIACRKLFAVAPLFRQRYNATGAGLAVLELAYLQEHSKQKELLEKANQLQ